MLLLALLAPLPLMLERGVGGAGERGAPVGVLSPPEVVAAVGAGTEQTSGGCPSSSSTRSLNSTPR